nr:MerR family DNA-binding transcriptional regulator [Dysosmobacter acutus]
MAGRTGISARTLHYYDEIGLLVPTERSGAGYRQSCSRPCSAECLNPSGSVPSGNSAVWNSGRSTT